MNQDDSAPATRGELRGCEGSRGARIDKVDHGVGQPGGGVGNPGGDVIDRGSKVGKSGANAVEVGNKAG